MGDTRSHNRAPGDTWQIATQTKIIATNFNQAP